MKVADIPTPALLVDVAALDRNIATMARFFAEGECRLRPHFKAHKTPAIARRQLAAGSCTGLTCATVFEAEVASSFCDDILIANEIIGPDKCARVAALPGTITIAVDSEEGLRQIAAAALAARKAGSRDDRAPRSPRTTPCCRESGACRREADLPGRRRG